MSELNELTKERIAEKVLKAVSDEKLLNIEAAKILGADGAAMSHLKRSENFGRITARTWTTMRAWYYSDKPLREFKLSQQAEQPEETIKDAAPAPVPIPEKTAKEYKAEACEAARKIRQEYEKEQNKQEKIILKRDPVEIDLRTGTLITITAPGFEMTLKIRTE